jgi:hypothetical protein
MSDRDRVIATIGKDLADQVGDVIVDYITSALFRTFSPCLFPVLS